MTTMQTAMKTWETAKPTVYGLAIGLLVGPFMSNYMGWQVTSGKATTERKAAVVEAMASVCNARARGDTTEPAKLDWTARNDLAKKWAVMPGSAAADPDVTSACASKLSA